MKSFEKDGSGWNYKSLLVCNLFIAVVIYFSMGSSFKSPWDEEIFFILNGSLREGRELWNSYWAFTNSKIFDSLSGLFLVIVCLVYLLKNRDNPLKERLSRVLLLIISVVIIMIMISRGFEHYYHQSPSQVLTPFVNINDLVSWIEVKTGTRKSFPSDHAAISFISVILMWNLFGKPYGFYVGLFALVNATPRLVGGGHWFGDVVIGGVLLAFFVSVWVLHTPLLALNRKIIGYFLSIPAINKISKSWP